MIITKEHQEAMIANYEKQGRNTFEVMGFVEGMEAMFNLVNKKLTNELEAKI